jgi:hypothetical protein
MAFFACLCFFTLRYIGMVGSVISFFRRRVPASMSMAAGV